MNKNLNDKIKESIKLRQLSKNLLLICLARLQERIIFSQLKLPELEKQRAIIAKAALDNGISKDELMQKIVMISSKDCPTDKTVKIISEICESGDYTFLSDFIPDKMIHYKTQEEILADSQRKPPIKKTDHIDETLRKLIDYIEKDLIYSKLTSGMIKELKSLKTGEYSYPVILLTFQDSKEKIVKAKWYNSFDSTYHYFKYILKIVKNELPDGLRRYKKRERDNQRYYDENFNEWPKYIASERATIEDYVKFQRDGCAKYGLPCSEETLKKNVLELKKRVEEYKKWMEQGEPEKKDIMPAIKSEYIHIFKAPEQKKLSPEMEALI